MKLKNNKQIHIYVDERIRDDFERNYPHCRSRFVENAMKLALKDKDIFDKIFFCDIMTNDRRFI